MLILSTQCWGRPAAISRGELWGVKSKPFISGSQTQDLSGPRARFEMSQFTEFLIITRTRLFGSGRTDTARGQDLYVFSCIARRLESGNRRSRPLGIRRQVLTAVQICPIVLFYRSEINDMHPISQLNQCTAAMNSVRMINARLHLPAPSKISCRPCLLMPGLLGHAKQ